MSQEDSGTRWEAGIDYATFTIRADSTLDNLAAWERFGALAMQQADVMGERRMASVLGYHGVVAGPVFVGRRADGGIVRVSGDLAEAVCRIERPASARCTRADVAITVWRGGDSPGEARETRDTLVARRLAGETVGPRRITYIDGCGDGDTLYVGSRSSDQMGRIYDKWRESGDGRYRFAWRYEIEFKGARADVFMREWTGSRARTDVLVSVARGFWESRGVDIAQICGIGEPRKVVVHARPYDPARTLAWIATDVRPAVQALLAVFGKDAILWALGLPSDVETGADGSARQGGV